MARFDITTLTRAADELLEVTENPLHRQILENYRRRALLEVTGQFELIFCPRMTVEHPVYHLGVGGESLTLDGATQVRGYYKSLNDREATVRVVEDEKIAVADWGFASEATYNSFVFGRDVPDASTADGYYIFRQKLAMICPHDERGRLRGEHIFEYADYTELIEVTEDDFIAPAAARATLLPLLRPLPTFVGEDRKGQDLPAR